MLDIPVTGKNSFNAESMNNIKIVSIWETTQQKADEF